MTYIMQYLITLEKSTFPVGSLQALYISKEQTDNLVASGKYLKPEGQEISIHDIRYQNLFKAIGYTYSDKTAYRRSTIKEFFKTFKLKQNLEIHQPINKNIFKIPDLRGYMLIKTVNFKKYSTKENEHIWRGIFVYKSDEDYTKIKNNICKILNFSKKPLKYSRSLSDKQGIVILNLNDAENSYFGYTYGDKNFCIDYGDLS